MQSNSADQSQAAPDLTPRVDIWVENGNLSVVIVNASIIEYQGSLVPGLSLNTLAAISLAEDILSRAREVIQESIENE